MQHHIRQIRNSFVPSIKIHKQEVRQQISRIRLVTIMAVVGSMVGIAGSYTVSVFTQMPFSALTRDPAAVAKSPVYIGLLSNIGVLFWSATTSVCMLGAVILRGMPRQFQLVPFLSSFGALSLLLTLDDVFMFHELVLPKYLHFPQKLVYVGYAVAIIGCLIWFLPTILTTDYLLLAIALLFMGFSVTIDAVMHTSNLETSIEDSLKFGGIVFWLVYFFRTTATLIHKAIRDT